MVAVTAHTPSFYERYRDSISLENLEGLKKNARWEKTAAIVTPIALAILTIAIFAIAYFVFHVSLFTLGQTALGVIPIVAEPCYKKFQSHKQKAAMYTQKAVLNQEGRDAFTRLTQDQDMLTLKMQTLLEKHPELQLLQNQQPNEFKEQLAYLFTYEHQTTLDWSRAKETYKKCVQAYLTAERDFQTAATPEAKEKAKNTFEQRTIERMYALDTLETKRVKAIFGKAILERPNFEGTLDSLGQKPSLNIEVRIIGSFLSNTPHVSCFEFTDHSIAPLKNIDDRETYEGIIDNVPHMLEAMDAFSKSLQPTPSVV